MDEVIKLLRGRVVLCGQLIKLINEWIDLLKINSSDTIELVNKISAIIKDLSVNAAKSQAFLDGVQSSSLKEFISAQEKDIKRDVAERLLLQSEKLQTQLQAKKATAEKLAIEGKKFADFTLNIITQTQTGNTYGAEAATSAQAKKHIFEANV